MVIHLLLLLSLGLLTRLVLSKSAITGFDTYGHLYLVKEVKDQKSGPFGSIKPNVVAAKDYRHPFLWHWLIGLISFELIYRNKKWINAVLDSIFVLTIYVILSFSFDPKTGLIVGLLYIFTPILFSGISTGPRIKSLTPRITSEMAVNLYFIFLLLPLPINEYVAIALAVIFGVYTLLSSKFGVQAIVLLSILTAILLLSYKILLVLLTSILISVVLTKGLFFETLKQQIIHLKWYFKKNLKREMSVSNRNSLKPLIDIVKDQHEKGHKKLAKVIKYVIKTNSFGVIFFKMPVLVVGIILCINSLFNNNLNLILPQDIYITVFAGVLIYLMVNIPQLLFIGEAERYLNHIIVLILLMTTILAVQLNLTWIVWSLIGYGIIYWLFETFLYNTLILEELDKREREKEETEIIQYLKTFKQEKSILTFPYQAVGTWRIMLETIHKTVYPIMVTKEFSKKYESKYDAGYPFAELNKIDEMNNDFGIDILIVKRRRVNDKYGDGWAPPKQWKLQQIAGEIFSVYKRE